MILARVLEISFTTTITNNFVTVHNHSICQVRFCSNVNNATTYVAINLVVWFVGMQIKGCRQCYKSVVNWFTNNYSMAKYSFWLLISSKTLNETIHQTKTGSHDARLVISRTDKEVNRSGTNEHTTLHSSERMGSSTTAGLSRYLYHTFVRQ